MSPSKVIKDLRLTFVVKIQCRATVSPPLISTLASEFPHSRYQNRHGLVWHLALLISARGIPVCSHLFTTAPIGDEAKYKKMWSFDLRRESTDVAGNAIFDFDLRSRVLDFNDASYTSMSHAPGALEEVGNVMKILEDSQISFSVDSKCGLHVYAGIKKRSKTLLQQPDPHGQWLMEPFKLKELQALCGLVTAAEPCIDAMVAPYRVRAEKCKTPSMTSGLAKMDVSKRMRKIGGTGSVLELVELMNPHKADRYAYKFARILRSNKKTRDGDFAQAKIEFLQHEGTLDAQEVINWLQVVAGMVRMSLRDDTLSRAKSWAISCDGEEFTFQKFLEKIGKAHLIGFYQQKASNHSVKGPRDHRHGSRAQEPTLSRYSSVSSVELGTPVDESLNSLVIKNDLAAEHRRYEERRRAKGATRSRTASSQADSSTTQSSNETSVSRIIPYTRHGSAHSRPSQYSRSGSSTVLDDAERSRRDTIVSIIDRYSQL